MATSNAQGWTLRAPESEWRCPACHTNHMGWLCKDGAVVVWGRRKDALAAGQKARRDFSPDWLTPANTVPAEVKTITWSAAKDTPEGGPEAGCMWPWPASEQEAAQAAKRGSGPDSATDGEGKPLPADSAAQNAARALTDN